LEKQRNRGEQKHVSEKAEAEIFKTHFAPPLFRCSPQGILHLEMRYGKYVNFCFYTPF
jgi:hypothetical protein